MRCFLLTLLVAGGAFAQGRPAVCRNPRKLLDCTQYIRGNAALNIELSQCPNSLPSAIIARPGPRGMAGAPLGQVVVRPAREFANLPSPNIWAGQGFVLHTVPARTQRDGRIPADYQVRGIGAGNMICTPPPQARSNAGASP